MTVPSKEATYTISANEQILAQSSYSNTNSLVLLTFIKRLITMGWTCVGSSNGTSCNTVDGASHSSLLLTLSDLVYNTAGNPHTWIVLENTLHGTLGAGNPQLLIDLSNNNGGHSYVYHYISPTGIFTNGNVTDAPTALDSIESSPFYDANNNQRPLHLSLDAPSNVNGRLNVISSNDGYSTYAILCASGKVMGIWGLCRAVNVSGSAWATPWVIMQIGPLYYNIDSFPTPNISNIKFKTAIGASTASVTLGVITENICYIGDTNRYLVNYQTSYDQETSEFPFCQIGLWATASPYIGRKGTIRDLYLSTYNIQPGMTYPDDGSKQWAQFGDFVFPWDGTNTVKML
ncbi:hypothetical protein UFOVP1290_64 [uncultured Caudovirales phage]|uniref:Uncharacterized protein n=1 Tax=uncultured Caudovirales phage TaxID=2100421 RepID=A0A6J5RX10_9CAUD|nr:hypothetical protein UFOVP1290_64 [uncultured Caudovirales phage]